MNKRRVVPLLLAAAGFGAATWLHPPWIAEERIPYGSQSDRPLGGSVDSFVPEGKIHARSAGYAWRFTGPPRTESEPDAAVAYRVDDVGLAWLWGLGAVGVCFAAVGLCPELVQLETAPTATNTWRGHLAARVPALIGGSLVLGWVLPIQTFLLCTLDTRTWFPVLGLTAIGLTLGHRLPGGYFRLRRVEVDGRIYSLLGVRRFRNLVSNGDLAVRLMRWIDPTIPTGLRRSTLSQHEARRRLSERLHWGYLLGSIPTMVWAVVVQKPGFAVYLLIANVFFNVYPIMLQRYTRVQLARIRGHPCCRVKESVAEPVPPDPARM